MENSQKRFIHFFLILTFGLIAVVAFGICAFINSQSQDSVESSSENYTPLKWVTHINSDLGYSFEAPENLIINRSDLYGIGGTNGIQENKDKDIFIGVYLPNTKDFQGEKSNFVLHFKRLDINYYTEIVDSLHDKKEISFNGNQFLYSPSQNPNSNNIIYYSYYSANPQKRLEVFTASESVKKTLADQILSTFKFIQ